MSQKKSEIASTLGQLKAIYTQKVTASNDLRMELTHKHDYRQTLKEKQRILLNEVNSMKQRSIQLQGDRRKLSQSHDAGLEEKRSLQCAIDESRAFRVSKQKELNGILMCIQESNFFLSREATRMIDEYDPILETSFMMQEELRSIECDMFAIQHKVHPDIEMLRARWANLNGSTTVYGSTTNGNGANMNDNNSMRRGMT